MADQILKSLRAERFRGLLTADAARLNAGAIEAEYVNAVREDLIWQKKQECEERVRARVEERVEQSRELQRQRAHVAREALERMAETHNRVRCLEQQRAAERDAKLLEQMQAVEQLEEAKYAWSSGKKSQNQDSLEQKRLVEELLKLRVQEKESELEKREQRCFEKLRQMEAMKAKKLENFSERHAQQTKAVQSKMKMIEAAEFKQRQQKLAKIYRKLDHAEQNRHEFQLETAQKAGKRAEKAFQNITKLNQSYDIARKSKLSKILQKENRSFSPRNTAPTEHFKNFSESASLKQRRAKAYRMELDSILAEKAQKIEAKQAETARREQERKLSVQLQQEKVERFLIDAQNTKITQKILQQDLPDQSILRRNPQDVVNQMIDIVYKKAATARSFSQNSSSAPKK